MLMGRLDTCRVALRGAALHGYLSLLRVLCPLFPESVERAGRRAA